MLRSTHIVTIVFAAVLALVPTPARAATLTVTGTAPAINGQAPRNTTIAVTFDRAVTLGAVQRVELPRLRARHRHQDRHLRALERQPDRDLHAERAVFGRRDRDGEPRHTISSRPTARRSGAPATPSSSRSRRSRARGRSQYLNAHVEPHRRPGGPQTRIYGAQATDLNHDGFLDLATVNEVSADVRVTLNTRRRHGLYGPFLTPKPIGLESSPNEQADFDNDGKTDGCFSAAAAARA